jgi:eukaryotic-like serine/threonine-protein kinase
VLHRALAPDLKSRYRTAGELGGALFQIVLDTNLCQTPRAVQTWLQQLLGLLV